MPSYTRTTDTPPRIEKSLAALVVPLLVIVLLLAYRWMLGRTSSETSAYLTLATWLGVSVVFMSRRSIRRGHGLAIAHALSRAVAGSSILVGLASLTDTLTSADFPLPAALFVISFVGYVIFCSLMTMSCLNTTENAQPDAAQLLDIWLPVGFGFVLMRDLRIIGCAIWSPNPARAQDVGDVVYFSNSLQAKPMLLALLTIAMVELVVGSILLSNAVEWIKMLHALFGVLFVVYVVGLIRSFAGFPTALDHSVLKIRMGLFFQADVDVRNLANVQRTFSIRDACAPDHEPSNAAILVAPNILLTLHKPVLARRLFKKDECTRKIALYVDEPERFMEALRPRADSATHLLDTSS